MKRLDLGQIIGVSANLSVLAGILLLVFELNQNRDMMRAQTRHDIASEFVGLMTAVAENAELANLIRRGDFGDELSADELYRYERFTRGVFRYWENVHYQYRLGMYDDSEFGNQKVAWRSYLTRSKGGAAQWCSTREQFSPEYQREMNELLTTFGCAAEQ